MRSTTWIAITGLVAAALLTPVASAHESYDIGDGAYTVTVGDQNEPMYTYKWTNLDLIIRDSDGEPVTLPENDEGTIVGLDAVLLAPGGEELNGTLEPQFGEEGRYEFAEGHFYTQPGQYTLRLEGEIQGVNATGSYDLPGPRQPGNEFAFPAGEVPTVNDLESQLATLENRIDTLEDNQDRIEEEQNATPGLGVGAALASLAAVSLLGARRRR